MMIREHYQRQIRGTESRLRESEVGKTHYVNVERLLGENVRVFHDHFIAYDAGGTTKRGPRTGQKNSARPGTSFCRRR